MTADTSGLLLSDGEAAAPLTVVLAHGAGAPMDSPAMAALAGGLAAGGLRVLRFEFPYMAARRQDGRRRPPDRQPVLLARWRDAVSAVPRPFAVGGKSLGGRMASLLADEVGAAALVCFGYPFHPPGRPERTRTTHLATLATPTLIVQGTRDPFGSPAEVAGYALSPVIRLHWLDDGDHDFRPRRASGRDQAALLAEAAAAAAAFCLDQVS